MSYIVILMSFHSHLPFDRLWLVVLAVDHELFGTLDLLQTRVFTLVFYVINKHTLQNNVHFKIICFPCTIFSKFRPNEYKSCIKRSYLRKIGDVHNKNKLIGVRTYETFIISRRQYMQSAPSPCAFENHFHLRWSK